MTKTRIKLITLDLDETLWPLHPTIDNAEQTSLRWLAERAPALVRAQDLDSMRVHRRTLKQERPDIAHDVTELRRLSLQQLLADHGHPPGEAADLAAGAMDLFLAHRNLVRPYPDTLEALRRLRSRFRLISVTNGNADPEHTPLAGLFEHRITAADAGAAKPDPMIFQMALSLTGCAPEESLHVGDEPVLDVNAARAIGLSAVWVNRSERDWPGALAPPQHEVRDLAQLAHWLETSIGGGDGI